MPPEGKKGWLEVARSAGHLGRGDRQPGRSARREPSSKTCGAPAAPSRSGRSTSTCRSGRRPWTAAGLSIDWYVERHREQQRGPPLGPHLGRAPPGLPVAGLAGRLGRVRPARLPVDAVLRLRRLHRLRHRARRGLPGPPGRRQPGHGAGPGRRGFRPRRPATVRGARPAPAGRAALVDGRTALTRLRIRFAKLGKVRWTSHRDTARMWERAFRRVDLPVAYSNGFSPRPRVSFGLALSTGYESVAEYLDIELSDSPPEGITPQLDLEGLTGGLSAALPEGVDVLAIAASSDRTLSLQEEVTLVHLAARRGLRRTRGSPVRGGAPGQRAAGGRVPRRQPDQEGPGRWPRTSAPPSAACERSM